MTTEDEPLVSIIILNFNGKKFLEDCLTSVFKTDYRNFEVIFVDNASNDGSVEFAKNLVGLDPRVKFVQNIQNLGFAKGNNVGVGFANPNAEYVVFLNNDTKVDPGWLKALIKTMESDPMIGVAQCKLLLYENPSVIDSVGGSIDRHGCVFETGRFKADNGQYDLLREPFSACFAAATVRKHVLEDVGVFDPNFFCYLEDVDLSWRARLKGFKIVMVPNAVVYHMRGETSSKVSLISSFHLRKNRLAMLIKNYGLKNLIKEMPITLSIYLLALCKDLFILNDVWLALTNVKALLWNLRELRYLIQQRIVVQMNVRRVSDDDILPFMSRKCCQLMHIRCVARRVISDCKNIHDQKQ